MKNIFSLFLFLTLLNLPSLSFAQTGFAADSLFIKKIFDESLANGKAYEWLRVLTTEIGGRLSGSKGAAKAVSYTQKVMESEGFDRVFLQDVKVPHWVRGEAEKAYIQVGGKQITVPIAALGGSVATPRTGIKAQIVEVMNFEQLRALGREMVAGKIVFYNRPMDLTKLNTFEAYAGAVDQRGYGATEAAKLGAVGAIVRSMTTRLDDLPHTGAMRYRAGVPLIPTAAISTNGAELLSRTLKDNPNTQFYFQQNCEALPDAASHNVIGETKGSTQSSEIISVGGHLDS